MDKDNLKDFIIDEIEKLVDYEASRKLEEHKGLIRRDGGVFVSRRIAINQRQ